MGVYDGYNPPAVAGPPAASTRVPEFAAPATASYWIARSCLTCYGVLIILSVTCFLVAPNNDVLRSVVPLGVVVAVLVCLVCHALGLMLGFIGLFIPSRRRSRAVWGILLNAFVPGCVATLAFDTVVPQLLRLL